MRLGLLVCLLALLVPIVLREQIPMIALEPPVSDSSSSVTPASPRIRLDQSRAKYPFDEIRREMVRAKAAIARCFWSESELRAGEYRLILRFDASSRLREILLEPKLSPDVTACLAAIVSAWRLPPNLSSRPFAFKADVRL